jgi:hypothetical protein
MCAVSQFLLIKGRHLLAVAACACTLTACAPPHYETNWGKVHAGMSKDEVEALLGKPSSTFSPQQTAAEPKEGARVRPRARERWQYGDTLSSLGTRAVFPEEADERTWCVFFGPDGRVTTFQRPFVPR